MSTATQYLIKISVLFTMYIFHTVSLNWTFGANESKTHGKVFLIASIRSFTNLGPRTKDKQIFIPSYCSQREKRRVLAVEEVDAFFQRGLKMFGKDLILCKYN